MSGGTRDHDGAALLALARAAVAEALGLPGPATIDAPILALRRGAFVTLTRGGRLRGCIGHIAPQPLRDLVPRMAREAAFDDPRFPPLSPPEFAALRFEVSVLGEPRAIADPGEVVVGTHGVIVRAAGRRGLLLPQVALEWNWSREELLSQVCDKAGLPRDAWLRPGVIIEVFTADVYEERD